MGAFRLVAKMQLSRMKVAYEEFRMREITVATEIFHALDTFRDGRVSVTKIQQWLRENAGVMLCENDFFTLMDLDSRRLDKHNAPTNPPLSQANTPRVCRFINAYSYCDLTMSIVDVVPGTTSPKECGEGSSDQAKVLPHTRRLGRLAASPSPPWRGSFVASTRVSHLRAG